MRRGFDDVLSVESTEPLHLYRDPRDKPRVSRKVKACFELLRILFAQPLFRKGFRFSIAGNLFVYFQHLPVAVGLGVWGRVRRFKGFL